VFQGSGTSWSQPNEFDYLGLTAMSPKVTAVGASALNGNLYFFEKN
jgi:hypothetical protein